MSSDVRIQNWGRTATAFCPTCHNDGIVVVGDETRPITVADDPTRVLTYEITAPCPACEKGLRTEFGIGKDEQHATRPPWGLRGFWDRFKPRSAEDRRDGLALLKARADAYNMTGGGS